MRLLATNCYQGLQHEQKVRSTRIYIMQRHSLKIINFAQLNHEIEKQKYKKNGKGEDQKAELIIKFKLLTDLMEE